VQHHFGELTAGAPRIYLTLESYVLCCCVGSPASAMVAMGKAQQ
jgi:hypothetical protein